MSFRILTILDNVIGTEPDMPLAEKCELANINVANEKYKWKARFDQKHSKPTLYEISDQVVIENEPAATCEYRKLVGNQTKGPYINSRILNEILFCILFRQD